MTTLSSTTSINSSRSRSSRALNSSKHPALQVLQLLGRQAALATAAVMAGLTSCRCCSCLWTSQGPKHPSQSTTSAGKGPRMGELLAPARFNHSKSLHVSTSLRELVRNAARLCCRE
jgi:hypothetical protein